LLPWPLAEIADYAGIDAAIVAAEKFASQRVSIPKQLRPGCPLISEIGEAGARALVALRPGERIYIQNARAAQIFYWRDHGMSVSQIARRLHMSIRGVSHNLKKWKDA
jgi:hypothetical protein